MMQATVKIDLDALVRNALLLKERLGNTFFVLKSDAYGHGLTRCAEALGECGFNAFAVYSLSEALAVRRAVKTGEVLILGRTDVNDAFLLKKHGFIQTVFSEEYVNELLPVSKGIRAHIKLDSGMNRFGFKNGADGIKNIFSRFSGEIEGVYTHFHGADCDDISSTEKELARFLEKAGELELFFNKKLFKHAAASACALRLQGARLDACRVGLALYGISPDNCDDLGLKPVMSFYAPIVSLKNVKKGENIGYGCDRYAKDDMLIAIASVGYGNGLARFLDGRFSPTLNGHSLPFVGRICMDRCMLDVTSLCGSVKVGDQIELFGRRRSVKSMSEAEMTVPYETLCRVGMMNKKEFI